MNEFERYFQEAANYHGHACAGIALGTKITLAAMHYLGLDPAQKNKNLIVFVEVDRCMADAVQLITRCTLGHRSLKYVDYGKFAASFVDTASGKAVRATIQEWFESKGPIAEVAAKIAEIPDKEMVILEDIRIEIAPNAMPGKALQRCYCQKCGERVMDGREVRKDGQILCRGCGGERYYSSL